MTLRKREDNGSRKRKHYIPIHVEAAVEENKHPIIHDVISQTIATVFTGIFYNSHSTGSMISFSISFVCYSECACLRQPDLSSSFFDTPPSPTTIFSCLLFRPYYFFYFSMFKSERSRVTIHLTRKHHHHIFFMELGHLLTRSGLTYPEVSSKDYHDSFYQLGSSISLSWVIYFEAFYLHIVSSFSCIPVSFRETCQWLKSPQNGLRAQSRVSPVVGLLTSASGPACVGMAFPPFLVKQLYRCDSVVISSFVRTGYTTRR